ncbi:MAG: DUF4185 domain-containing protein [Acidobacteriota bacterium]
MRFSAIYIFCFVFAVFGAIAGAGSVSGASHLEEPVSVEPWQEADALFKTDSRWLGGDDAYSVDLGKGRVLWLFADSFIARDNSGLRRNARLIRNSVAIQQGYNPASASIKFYWNKENQNPQSFFADSATSWYWPGQGIKLGNRLLIFLMKVRQTGSGLGFALVGWDALMVDNPDASPDRWKMRRLEVAENPFKVIIGSAGVLQNGAYLYTLSAREAPDHKVYLIRWSLAQAKRGQLSDPQWWTGGLTGWVRQSRLKQEPEAVFSDGQTEFTVHFEPRLKKFLQIQTIGFGASELALRLADKLTGQWSALNKFYRPEETRRADALIYAGKAHPELSGADLVLTYVVNSKDFGTLVNDQNLYYPKFLKCRINGPANRM